jgi:glycosyltransferase involved in cell wall biosynthesis
MNRVAFLLGNLTDGGSETKTVRLANRLAGSEFSVHIIYLGEPHTLRPAIDESVTVEFLDRRSKYSYRALRNLRAYLDSNEIETVFCVNQYALAYGWPACRLSGRKPRCIGSMNTYDVISLRDRLFMLIYGYILRRCDLVVFGSEAQQDLWLRKYRLRRDRADVIYNGVDVRHFRESQAESELTRQSLGIEDDAIVVGCIAQLRPEKSHVDLLMAMNMLAQTDDSKIRLLLVGDGPEAQRLKEYADANNLSSRAIFCGRAADVRPYLALMDIFAMPSTVENFSNAILEAMTVGLPVVCTAVGGSEEIVTHGETGITYPRHDIRALVEALRSLAADRGKREQMGARGAARIQDMFSIERMDETYRQLIVSASRSTDRG